MGLVPQLDGQDDEEASDKSAHSDKFFDCSEPDSCISLASNSVVPSRLSHSGTGTGAARNAPPTSTHGGFTFVSPMHLHSGGAPPAPVPGFMASAHTSSGDQSTSSALLNMSVSSSALSSDAYARFKRRKTEQLDQVDPNRKNLKSNGSSGSSTSSSSSSSKISSALSSLFGSKKRSLVPSNASGCCEPRPRAPTKPSAQPPSGLIPPPSFDDDECQILDGPPDSCSSAASRTASATVGQYSNLPLDAPASSPSGPPMGTGGSSTECSSYAFPGHVELGVSASAGAGATTVPKTGPSSTSLPSLTNFSADAISGKQEGLIR